MRDNNEYMNSILDKSFSVLDRGFIKVVDYMGSDQAIADSARISYGEGTKKTSSYRGLLRYLMRHEHTSPFEMCEIKLHIKMPMFIARQWLRHRTASVNEYSARYSIMTNEFYIPDANCIGVPSKSNKQARLINEENDFTNQFIQDLEETSSFANTKYNNALENNIPRELARCALPVNAYTQIFWKIDVHNLLKFIRLRIHETAQHEIQEYAKILLDIVKGWLPITHEAFVDFSLNRVLITSEQKLVLQKYLDCVDEDDRKTLKDLLPLK